MEKEMEELCPKGKSDYLKPTADHPRKMICNFCGAVASCINASCSSVIMRSSLMNFFILCVG
jgi:hypothetical protein